jgi:hypothetical protein
MIIICLIFISNNLTGTFVRDSGYLNFRHVSFSARLMKNLNIIRNEQGKVMKLTEFCGKQNAKQISCLKAAVGPTPVLSEYKKLISRLLILHVRSVVNLLGNAFCCSLGKIIYYAQYSRH